MSVKMGSFWSGFASALAGIALLVYVVLPQYADYTDRAEVADVILSAQELRTAVEENILTKKRVAGAGEGLPSAAEWKGRARITERFVTTDGVVLAQGGKPGTLVALVPSLQGEKVVWRCLVGPKKDAPVSCQAEAKSR